MSTLEQYNLFILSEKPEAQLPDGYPADEGVSSPTMNRTEFEKRAEKKQKWCALCLHKRSTNSAFNEGEALPNGQKLSIRNCPTV